VPVMTRSLTCPGCGALVRLEEKASKKTGKLIYYCRPCLTRYGFAPSDPGDLPPLAASGSETVRLRVPRLRKSVPTLLEELVDPSERDPIPSGVCLTLDLVEGPDKGRSVKMEWTRAVVGRLQADIHIEDPSLSRRHALIEIYDAETVLLKDLSSTNGTYQNGRLIDHCKLADGDELRLGSTVITVLLEPPA